MEDITAQCVYIDMFFTDVQIYINTINWESLQYFIALSQKWQSTQVLLPRKIPWVEEPEATIM